MRFDDGLDTVLAMEMTGPLGVQSVWRQVVDLLGRGRGGPHEAALTRLRLIRDDVPVAVRAASARGLERADPPAALVALFSDDAAEVAAPVVRSARLTAAEWIALLPGMRPETRGVLRHRRDLSDQVTRALESFGPSDFALPAADLTEALIAPAAAPLEAAVWPPAFEPERSSPVARDPVGALRAFVPADPPPFVAVADVVRDLPVVAEALRRANAPVVDSRPIVDDDFRIAEIVARIDAHQRVVGAGGGVRLATVAPAAADRFRFETDATGVIRWCDCDERGPVIGLSLAAHGNGAPAADGAVGGALTRRARFADARLAIPGGSAIGGAWRISAAPVFDHASGRFTGYRGAARRPRPDEEPRVAGATQATDALRQLVHELRTPANAISGFAEMIEREMLGPVPSLYRERAAAIRSQTIGLLDAIGDIDTAARLESGSLGWRADQVPAAPLLTRVMGDLHPLAKLRGAFLTLEVAQDVVIVGDAIGVERMFSRLLTAIVAATTRGETVAGSVTLDGDQIRCDLSRPAALKIADGALFSVDAEQETPAAGGPLLGGGFAFRLARKLIAELGGTLTIGSETLTVRLPAAVDRAVEQATV